MNPTLAFRPAKSRLLPAALLFLGFAVGALSSDWPQWHGPTRTGHAAADAPALVSLPKELKPAWKIRAGGGHSSPVVAGDRKSVV